MVIVNEQSPTEALLEKGFLVVDDQEDIVYILQMMIEETGHNAHCYSNPLKALTAFKESPLKFHGIFTDLRMPLLAGEKLIEEIRNIDKDIPIVIVTANAYTMTPEDRKKLNITLLIEKPFDGTIIEKAISLIKNKKV